VRRAHRNSDSAQRDPQASAACVTRGVVGFCCAREFQGFCCVRSLHSKPKMGQIDVARRRCHSAT
jgi:hypothetical protein